MVIAAIARPTTQGWGRRGLMVVALILPANRLSPPPSIRLPTLFPIFLLSLPHPSLLAAVLPAYPATIVVSTFLHLGDTIKPIAKLPRFRFIYEILAPRFSFPERTTKNRYNYYPSIFPIAHWSHWSYSTI